MTERALLVQTSFASSGRFAAVAIEHASARVFDTTTGALLATAEATDYANTQITALACFVPAGRVVPTVVMGTDSGRVCIYDTASQTMKSEVVLTEVGVPVAGLSYVASSLFLALGATGTVSVFDASTGACVAAKLKTPVARAAALDVTAASGTKRCVAVVGSAAMCAAIDVPLDGTPDGAKCETRCLFTGHATSPSKLMLLPEGNAAFSSTNGDGVIRLWDLRPASHAAQASPANAPSDRCRRTLLAGHRMLDMQMQVLANETIVAASTIVGSVVLWRFDAVAYAADQKNHVTPVAPFARIASAVGPGRLLAASVTVDGTLLVVRGRWATPAFEALSSEVLEEAHKAVSRGTSSSTQVHKLPFFDATDAKQSSVNIVANKRKHPKDAMLVSTTEIESVTTLAVSVPLAHSLDELPTAVKGGATEVAGSATGILIPLHQALHAKDESLATELIMVAARTEADVAATVAGLQLPYLIELLRILARRVLTASLSSPVHGWLNAVLSQRGAELATVAKGTDELATAVKKVLTPVLAHYRQLATLQNSISVLYGRSSIFKSTRVARGKATFLNNFEEPRRVGATRFVRMSALGDGTIDDPDANADDLRRPTRRGRRATKNAREARKRVAAKEALVAEDDEDDDADALLAGGRSQRLRDLDDAGGDDDGDDGSEKMGDADGVEEEEGEWDDEEGDESFDDEDLDDLDDEDPGLGGSGDDLGDGEDDDDGVEYESGASGQDEEDVDAAGFTAAARQHDRQKHGRLNVDADDEDEDDDDG